MRLAKLIRNSKFFQEGPEASPRGITVPSETIVRVEEIAPAYAGLSSDELKICYRLECLKIYRYTYTPEEDIIWLD